jgi:hypothetical protein
VVPVWSIILGIITLIQFFGWWQPHTQDVIFYHTEDRDVAEPPRNFSLSMHTENGKPATMDGKLSETDVTIWRNSGGTIKKDEVRKPLTISLPSGSRIVGFKVLETRKSASENFIITPNENTVEFTWDIFDPGSAVKLTLLRVGSDDDVQIASYVGPAVEARPGYSHAKRGFIAIVALVGFVAFMVGGILIWDVVGNFFDMTANLPKLVAYPLRVCSVLACLACIGGAPVIGIYSVNWLKNAIIGIPFAGA